MRETAKPDLLVSALEYDRGRSCAVVSLAGRADIGDCAWIRPLLERQAELIWAGQVISTPPGRRADAGRSAARRRTVARSRRRVQGGRDVRQRPAGPAACRCAGRVRVT